MTQISQKLNYNEIINQIKFDEGHPIFIVEKNWFIQFTDYLQNKKNRPGSLNQSNILNLEDQQKLEIDHQQSYTNIMLKCDIRIGVDFVLLNKYQWSIIQKEFGGTEIKRYVISQNDYCNFNILELHLKLIKIVVFDSFQTIFNIKYIQISKMSTLEELVIKIKRIFDINKDQYRLYKLFSDQVDDFKQSLNNQNQWNKQKQLSIMNSYLKVYNQNIDQLDLQDEDILILEFKFFKDFILTNQKDLQIQQRINECGYCHDNQINLKFCQCKSIKYCNKKCQMHHRSQHMDECITYTYENLDIELISYLQVSLDHKFNIESSNFGLTGIQNLGNTCFMNSALQCLSNIFPLTHYFITNKFIQDINLQNKLGTKGHLASQYSEVLKQIWTGKEQYIVPIRFKRCVEQFAPRFRGYNQQDSQEFLQYLLDGLNEDLNKVRNKPYIEFKDSNNRSDEIVAQEYWKGSIYLRIFLFMINLIFISVQLQITQTIQQTIK